MKTLILVRHGKSSWELPVDDVDRPLNTRGIKDAHAISKAYAAIQKKPQKIYTSIANRALHTAVIFKRNLDVPDSLFQINTSLYNFSEQPVLKYLQSLDDALDRIMVFGHNNAFNQLVNSLGNRYIDKLPTTGLVQLELASDHWGTIRKGRTVLTLFAKDLQP